MAVRPRTDFRSAAVRGRRGIPTTTGRLHLAGITERGPDEPTLVPDLAAFDAVYGEDSRGVGVTRDYVECVLGSGGAEIVLSRVAGPAAVKASVTLNDTATTPAPTLRIDAIGVGDYGNAITVTVTDQGTTFTIAVTEGDTTETFAGLTDVQAAVGALAASTLVRGVDLASPSADPNPAAIADATLTGGTSDLAAITTADWTAALDRDLGERHGPGQVAFAGLTATAGHTYLATHAKTHNRYPLFDAPNGTADFSDIPAAEDGRGYVVSSWVQLAPLAGATPRAVPGSAMVAGLMAAGDAREGHANHSPAGENGRSPVVVGVTREFTDAEWEALDVWRFVNRLRVNRDGGREQVEVFGLRTTEAEGGDYAQVGWAREAMLIEHQLDIVAGRHLFKLIGGRGIELAAFKDDARVVFGDQYRLGALFGATAEDAFFVDVDDPVNTAATLDDGQLHARHGAKFAPSAELVVNNFAKYALDVPFPTAA